MWWIIILIIPGTIITLMVLSIVIGNITFTHEFKKAVEKLLKGKKDAKPKLVTDNDIKNLPEPVQKYLIKSQITGKELIDTVRLKQKGILRMKPGQKGMPFKAEQYFTTNPPGFAWCGNVEPIPFITVKAIDMLCKGKGSMLIKLLGLIKIAHSTGPEMDQSALLRYLSEIVWLPTAFLSDYIQWEPDDSGSAKATVSDKEVTTDATFYFNAKGDITNVVGERYRSDNGKPVLDKWSTESAPDEYKEVNDIRIQNKGKAIWHLDTGEFQYIDLEVTDIEYNTRQT